ncbi:MAG: hypothetical protein FJW69_06955 [Actinobacteria bacterium]|nr:hypothetical protein [Actinomycetota bacterium]MBM3713318.1 hypothetical protein [Actinomycetota bacterium]
MHRNLKERYCISCNSRVALNVLIEKILNNEFPPISIRCGDILRPNIVLFEDLLPDIFLDVKKEVKNSGILIIIGYSL